MLPLLTQMTGAPELFESTKNSLGLKDFRRLEIKKILESEENVDIKLRNIGEYTFNKLNAFFMRILTRIPKRLMHYLFVYKSYLTP